MDDTTIPPVDAAAADAIPQPPLWPTERVDLDRLPPADPSIRWLGGDDDYRSWTAGPAEVSGRPARFVDQPASFTDLVLPESSLAESTLVASTRRRS